MNLHPGQRVAEDVAVRQRALRACAHGNVLQPPLQRDDLPQALDVAPRQRQFAEPRPAKPAVTPEQKAARKKLLATAAYLKAHKLSCGCRHHFASPKDPPPKQ